MHHAAAKASRRRQRSSKPGEIGFTFPHVLIRVRCECLDGTGAYAHAFERLPDGSRGRLLAEGEAVWPLMRLEVGVATLAA